MTVTFSWKPILIVGGFVALVIFLLLFHRGGTVPNTLAGQLAKQQDSIAGLHRLNDSLSRERVALQARMSADSVRASKAVQHAAALGASAAALQARADSLGAIATADSTNPKWMHRALDDEQTLAATRGILTDKQTIIASDSSQIAALRTLYAADTTVKNRALVQLDSMASLAGQINKQMSCKLLGLFSCPTRKRSFVVGTGVGAVLTFALYHLSALKR